jgi:hypothetical protein
MAANEQPVPTSAGAAPNPRAEQQVHSKRERKRIQLMEKLSVMSEKFNRDRDMTYRDQLQKIQVDTNLVQRIDPYASNALEVLAEMRKEHKSESDTENLSDGARSLIFMAGIRFPEFIQAVEDHVEQRDFNLTRQKVCNQLVPPQYEYSFVFGF